MIKPINLIKGMAFFILLLFMLQSCRKDHAEVQSKDFMETAKKYYQSQLAVRPSRNPSDVNIRLYKAEWSKAVYTRTPNGLLAIAIPMIGPKDEHIELDIVSEKNGGVSGAFKRYIAYSGKLITYSGSGRLRMMGNYDIRTNKFAPDYRGQFLARSLGGDLDDVTITPDNPNDPNWPPFNPPTGPSDPSGPSGPSNPNNPGNPNPGQDVTINVKNDCIKSGLLKALGEDVKSKIKGLMAHTFMANSNVNLDFESYPFSLNGPNATADATATAWNASNPLSQVISFNENLLPNKSQEYIVATVYHEILHAYFANLFEIDQQGKFIVPPDHNYMATDYIAVLSDDLRSLYPTMTETEAWALSWAGLEKTSSYSILTAIQKADINNINLRYSTKPDPNNPGYSKGTYCQ